MDMTRKVEEFMPDIVLELEEERKGEVKEHVKGLLSEIDEVEEVLKKLKNDLIKISEMSVEDAYNAVKNM